MARRDGNRSRYSQVARRKAGIVAGGGAFVGSSGDGEGTEGPQGPQGDVGPQGIQGPPGDTGPAGADGAPGTSAWTLVTSGTFVTSPVNITGLDAYNEIIVFLKGSTATSSGVRYIQVSTNNGTSYFGSSGNYVHTPDTGAEAARSTVEIVTGTTGARTGMAHILDTRAVYKIIETSTLRHAFVADTVNNIDALRIHTTAGTLNGGTYYIYGR